MTEDLRQFLLADPLWIDALASALNVAPFDVQFALENQVPQKLLPARPTQLPMSDLMSGSAKGYVAGGTEYLYPGAGDKPPPGGAKVNLLTTGGICVQGTWPTTGCIGWAPLPLRNKDKEKLLKSKE